LIYLSAFLSFQINQFNMAHIKRPKSLITFKPISGNRFRCNQTGEVTTRPKEYRHAHLRGLEKKTPLTGKKAPKAKPIKPVKRHWWES
jgi:hypothetical protein